MKIPATPRQRLVLGNRANYATYLRNFLYTPASALRLITPGQLHGIRPNGFLVVLIPGWQDEATSIPGLFSATCDWKARWRDIGTETIDEAELLGGLPVRQANLLKKYQEMIECAGTNYLAIANGKDWIRRLDDRDQNLLLKALGLHEKGQDTGAKK